MMIIMIVMINHDDDGSDVDDGGTADTVQLTGSRLCLTDHPSNGYFSQLNTKCSTYQQ